MTACRGANNFSRSAVNFMNTPVLDCLRSRFLKRDYYYDYEAPNFPGITPKISSISTIYTLHNTARMLSMRGAQHVASLWITLSTKYSTAFAPLSSQGSQQVHIILAHAPLRLT